MFKQFSSLKVNFDKSDLCGIGAKKGVEGAFCGVKCLNLLLNSIKILGVHFSYFQSLYNVRNYLTVLKSVQEVLNLWSARGRIHVFKTFGISKILYMFYMNQVPSNIIEELKRFQSSFIWKGKKPKIKHSSLIGDFASGGYKDIDIDPKIKSLHLMWVKGLCDNNFHPWKIIPLEVLAFFGGTSIFHPNLSTSTLAVSPQMPKFYIHLINLWGNKEFT